MTTMSTRCRRRARSTSATSMPLAPGIIIIRDQRRSAAHDPLGAAALPDRLADVRREVLAQLRHLARREGQRSRSPAAAPSCAARALAHLRLAVEVAQKCSMLLAAEQRDAAEPTAAPRSGSADDRPGGAAARRFDARGAGGRSRSPPTAMPRSPRAAVAEPVGYIRPHGARARATGGTPDRDRLAADGSPRTSTRRGGGERSKIGIRARGAAAVDHTSGGLRHASRGGADGEVRTERKCMDRSGGALDLRRAALQEGGLHTPRLLRILSPSRIRRPRRRSADADAIFGLLKIRPPPRARRATMAKVDSARALHHGREGDLDGPAGEAGSARPSSPPPYFKVFKDQTDSTCRCRCRSYRCGITARGTRSEDRREAGRLQVRLLRATNPSVLVHLTRTTSWISRSRWQRPECWPLSRRSRRRWCRPTAAHRREAHGSLVLGRNHLGDRRPPRGVSSTAAEGVLRQGGEAAGGHRVPKCSPDMETWRSSTCRQHAGRDDPLGRRQGRPSPTNATTNEKLGLVAARYSATHLSRPSWPTDQVLRAAREDARPPHVERVLELVSKCASDWLGIQLR